MAASTVSSSSNIVSTSTAIPGSAVQSRGSLHTVHGRHLNIHDDDVGPVQVRLADRLVA
jgi:hypothetical protein